MRKIGLFGGSFDPIHLGHINLAIQMKENYFFDEILFCPANISPHKVKVPPVASGMDRMEMINLAIEEIEGFSSIDIELQRGGVSYTVDTAKELVLRYPDAKLELILAQDAIQEFDEWKDVEILCKLLTPRFASREASTKAIKDFFSKFPYMTEKNLIKTADFEICSTYVRQRLKKGLYCGHLLSAKVLDYIYKNHLYYS